MENILNQLESKYLNFKLGEEQRNALLSIFSFIDTKGFEEYSFIGAAGTGKTTCIELIIRYLEQKKIPYQLVCPTHKSKKILANTTNRDVITIHQLLALKPSIDIMDLDMKDLKFDIKSSDSVPHGGVVIIDECSMVNDALYEAILESCKEKTCKVIFSGDSRQIAPVKQRRIAKTFECTKKSELTQIYRQSGENCVRDVLDQLRKCPLKTFSECMSDKGNIFVYNNASDLIYSTIDLFKEAVITSNPNRIKLVAYTNKRVSAFNKCIRSHIFKQEDLPEYVKGDILFGYDGSECRGQTIENSGDYQVQAAYKTTEEIAHIPMEGWWLDLYDFDQEQYKTVFVLSINNDKSKFEQLGEEIEYIRQFAIQAQGYKRKQAWTDYYKIMNTFLTPIDIVWDNRVIRCKSIDYGYAITSHKSQSSSFDDVAVDINNILLCKDMTEVRQMEYVALSRTRRNVYLLN